MEYEVTAQLWRYPGKAAWFFVTLPQTLTAGIKSLRGRSTAFGSVRVLASIGDIGWSTSIFPDTKSGSFLLPIKSEVRRKAGLKAGDEVSLKIEIAL